MNPQGDAEKRLLLERARHFAAAPPSEEEAVEVLVCEVGTARVALELPLLRGVVRPEWVPLPDLPAGVLGVQSVRGEVVSVLSLAALLDQADAERAPERRLVLLETPQGTVGLQVDAVEGVQRLALSTLRPAPAGRAGVRGVLEGRTLLLEPLGLLRTFENT